ncbi:MAG: Fe-S cluster assembly protein SufD [Acetobacteraceae bacterium]|nr:Fe-S cluster assembly protein SufD [Acetobacteraceae bacterium]
MNAISVPEGAAGFLARFAAMQGRLPGDSTLRAAAAEAFRALGLPGASRGRRVEAWKYTTLQPLGGMSFRSAEPAGKIAIPDSPARIVFAGGRYREDLSTAVPGFACFADQPDFGELSWPDRDPMVALNTMLAEDGAILTVPAGIDAGIVHLIHAGIDGTSAHPRHMIRLGGGARLTLIETSAGSGRYLHNPVSEIHVADGAVLTHVRIQTDGTEAFHLATIYAAVAAGGTYDGFTLNIGGRTTRTEIHATLNGPGAIAHLNGAQLLTGSQHADFTSVVRHAGPKGTSRQTIKNVLAGHSRGVFQGRIEVARGAQGTDGYQMNRALLLSPDAEIDTKPELEIFADDVKCSHGATVGELDAEQLFYLRSRGIPDNEARSILVRAFLAEALDPVTNDIARGLLEDAVALWWEGQAG